MTDYEKWKAHFTAFNIAFETGEVPPNASKRPPHKFDETLWIATDEGEGYSGFTFTIYFNKDQSFKYYGVWE